MVLLSSTFLRAARASPILRRPASLVYQTRKLSQTFNPQVKVLAVLYDVSRMAPCPEKDGASETDNTVLGWRARPSSPRTFGNHRERAWYPQMAGGPRPHSRDDFRQGGRKLQVRSRAGRCRDHYHHSVCPTNCTNNSVSMMCKLTYYTIVSIPAT